eukprot:scaffold2790_cov118-Skeletonema_dohrnii-CCMP3373.AAC.7
MSGERLILDEKWPTHGTYTCIKQPTATAQTHHTRGRGEPSKQNSPKKLPARSTVEAILMNFIVYF